MSLCDYVEAAKQRNALRRAIKENSQFENEPDQPPDKPVYSAFGIEIARERPDGSWVQERRGRIGRSGTFFSDGSNSDDVDWEAHQTLSYPLCSGSGS